jgi:hypothetical protein
MFEGIDAITFNRRFYNSLAAINTWWKENGEKATNAAIAVAGSQ